MYSVVAEDIVCPKYGQLLYQTLGNQEPIEGIAVVKRQAGHLERMAHVDGEQPDVVPFDLGRDE